MNKIISYFFSFTLFMASSASALGLGPMELKSSLDQPFLAKIDLINLKGLSIDEIKISLAKDSDFVRAGIERPHLLSQLQFEINENPLTSDGIITITSEESFSEPYLRFMVDVAWPEGRLFRVYTILLTPPKQKIIGPTRFSDRFWSLAKANLPSPKVSIEQTMLAILGHNPEAFLKGNVNGMMAGYTLKIPDITIIETIAKDLAKAEVAKHNIAWQTRQEIVHVLVPPYYASTVEALADKSIIDNNNIAEKLKPVRIDQEQIDLALDDEALSATVFAALQKDLLIVKHQMLDLERKYLKLIDSDEGYERELLQWHEHVVNLTDMISKHLTEATFIDDQAIDNLPVDVMTEIQPVTPQLNIGLVEEIKTNINQSLINNKTILLSILILFFVSLGVFYYRKKRSLVSSTNVIEETQLFNSNSLPSSKAADEEFSGELSDEDRMASKIDLAVAYIKMEDTKLAKKLLDEVINHGNEEQRDEAKQWLAGIKQDKDPSDV